MKKHNRPNLWNECSQPGFCFHLYFFPMSSQCCLGMYLPPHLFSGKMGRKLTLSQAPVGGSWLSCNPILFIPLPLAGISLEADMSPILARVMWSKLSWELKNVSYTLKKEILLDMFPFFLWIVFLYFFTLITKEDFLIPPCYSLELCIQMSISCSLL